MYQEKQPIIKLPNSYQQQFVPDYMKDNKYWVKRKKNNESAKMSREAQRIKGDLFLLCHKKTHRAYVKIFLVLKFVPFSFSDLEIHFV